MQVVPGSTATTYSIGMCLLNRSQVSIAYAVPSTAGNQHIRVDLLNTALDRSSHAVLLSFES